MGPRMLSHRHFAAALCATAALCSAGEELGMSPVCSRGGCAGDHAMIQQRAVAVQASASENVPHILLPLKGVGPQEIEPSLAQLTSDVVTGQTTLSNDTKVVLAGIHDAMDDLIGNTGLSFKEDQREINRSYDAIKDCDQNVAEDMSSELANRTTMREQSHHQCRLVEKQMKERRDSRCGEFQSIIAQANPPAFPNRPSVWTYDEVKEFIAFAETYQSWATDYNASLETAKQKCDESTRDHAAHRSSCNKFQTAFETQFCDYSSALTRMCASYKTCRNKTVAAQSEVHEAVAKVEAARKAEFAAAKHVQCYVRVLGADASEQVDQFNLCKAAVINTAHLDITYNPVPDAVECETSGNTRVGQAPCHEEFLSVYYTSKGWYDEAPTETCSSCSEEDPAPSPTPSTSAPPASSTTVDEASIQIEEASIQIEVQQGQCTEWNGGGAQPSSYYLMHTYNSGPESQDVDACKAKAAEHAQLESEVLAAEWRMGACWILRGESTTGNGRSNYKCLLVHREFEQAPETNLQGQGQAMAIQ